MCRRACVVSVALHLVVLAACSFDARGVPVSDDDLASPAGLDHTMRADSAVADAPPALDQPRLDSGSTPDTKPSPDTKPLPDAKPLPDTKSTTTCAKKYGAVASYKLCKETATDCFFFHKAGDSCTSICSKCGGTCLKAEWDTNDTCTASKPVACSDYQSDGLCTCTK